MNRTEADSQRSLRWGIYAILIALAIGNMTGRLLSVNSVNRADLESHLIQQDLQKKEKQLRDAGLQGDELAEKLEEAKATITKRRRLQRPFLSANDRSRWLAIRAVAEKGTYEIDSLLDRNVWNTIDMVQHRGRDGELHLYSSKPPLLGTLLAGPYWLVMKLTGMTLETHPYFIGRALIFLFQVLPLAGMVLIVADLAEKFSRSDWVRVFVVASASLGTMLTTFAVVLNNHVFAAVSAACTLWFFARIWCDDSQSKWDYLGCGFFAAFTAANELPALAFLALVGLGALVANRGRCLTLFTPAVLLVAAAFFGTNYLAHDTFSPPYAHRSETNPDDNWYSYTYTIEGREYKSYWLDPQGVDRGERSKWTYAFHVLLGHHGVFSLTPIWLLSAAGLLCWFRPEDSRSRWIALAIALLSVVCLTFFIALRPLQDRNYGGMTSGFRWVFWLAPLWLWAMIPAIDRLARSKLGRGICLVLLALSVLSASYPTWNPWTQPWIYDVLASFDLLGH